MSVKSLLHNRTTSADPTLPDESKEKPLFDGERDFTPAKYYGSRITLARTSAGLSLREAANALGHMHVGTLQGWENEVTTPRRSSFIDIGIAFETPVSWLMFGQRLLTPNVGLALRLTAMQKIYDLSNHQVAALMETTNDETLLQESRGWVFRMTNGRNAASPDRLRRLAVALQVPTEWLQPPTPISPRFAVDTLDAPTATALAAAKISPIKDIKKTPIEMLSNGAQKLIADIVDLIEMGVITEEGVKDLRAHLGTAYMDPYIEDLKKSARLQRKAA